MSRGIYKSSLFYTRAARLGTFTLREWVERLWRFFKGTADITIDSRESDALLPKSLTLCLTFLLLPFTSADAGCSNKTRPARQRQQQGKERRQTDRYKIRKRWKKKRLTNRLSGFISAHF